ncbi:MAG: 16S rRNA (cytosine(1402)-N(4))-methyltransferase RsmH, partial [Gammaproteobacteria bacterium]|nr:16S rRNA (cytosine(1402)-N(4))-methyltransferase RsmH [Gammaproteobacteria bacterium]
MLDHQPVLLHATLEALAIRPDGCYVDATFGRGGHSAAILERLDRNGLLLVADRDPDAIAAARKRFGNDDRVIIVHDSFANLRSIVKAHGLNRRVDGLLLDIGVSSPQLDEAARGFSFANDGPLDMRMDTSRGETAAQWIARADESEITDVIRRYGEERMPRRIARAIVAARAEQPITTTAQLAAIVAAAIPQRDRKRHPATRVFQAIRIHINAELAQLEDALEASLDVLA